MLNTNIGIGIRSGGISNSRGWTPQSAADLSAIIQSGTEIYLLWRNAGVIDYDSIVISRGEDEESLTTLVTIDAENCSYKDTVVDSSVSYYYSISYLKGSILSEPSVTVHNEYFDQSSLTLFEAMPTQPLSARKIIYDTLIKGLKTSGLWAKLDVLQCYAAHAADSSLINLINPGTNNANAVGSPTYTTDEGYLSASGKYINTGFNPASDTYKFKQDSFTYGVYSRTDKVENTVDVGNRSGSVSNYMQLAISTGNFVARLNDAVSGFIANTHTLGLFAAGRHYVNSRKAYINGVNGLTDTQVSTGLPNCNIFVGCYNSDGTPTTPSTKQYSWFFAGGAMTVTEVATLTTLIETYMDAIGKGVIA